MTTHKPIILWVFALTVVLVLTPLVRAQSTSVTSVQAPSEALLGSDVTVTVALTYNAGTGGMYLLASIFDGDTNSYAKGTATSAQNTCGENTGQFSNSAACGYGLPAGSGSDVVTFHLEFDAPKTYNLGATVFLGDVNFKPIPDSLSGQKFSITVYAPGTTPPPNSPLENPTVSLSLLGIVLAIGVATAIATAFSRKHRHRSLRTDDGATIAPYTTDEATRKELEDKWREQYLKRERARQAGSKGSK